MFLNNQKLNIVLENVAEDTITVLHILKYKKNTYKLFCDTKKASGTIGVNVNFCISKLTDSGWVVVADIKDLCLENVNVNEENEVNLKRIEKAFEKFTEFAKKL